jgi:divalent metal cation (Fe/Co/Zn/Cd) transporter
MTNRPARFYIVLSILAVLVTMGVKFLGYVLTGSVGLFSDAAESVVNLVAALVALWALTLAVRPPDEEHAFGHTKSEYFSSGVEGALILVAALVIVLQAIPRLLHPQPLEQVGIGLAFSVSRGVINGVLAAFMLRAGPHRLADPGPDHRTGCRRQCGPDRGAVWRFISFHLLVPGGWTIARGHSLSEEIEADIRHVLPESTIFTYLEPREDPVSFADQRLDRDPKEEIPPYRAETRSTEAQ